MKYPVNQEDFFSLSLLSPFLLDYRSNVPAIRDHGAQP
jgi:hypothetical protein